MKILVIILFFYSLISGCGSLVTVPIDQKLLSQDKATMIVYHDQGFSDDFRVFIDHQFIGQVTSEKPLKITVEPGQHDLYVELPMGHIALIVFKLCSFKFYVSHLLNKIHPPVCRQLNVETIEAIFKASNSEYTDHVIYR